MTRDPRKKIKRIAHQALGDEISEREALRRIYRVADDDEVWDDDDEEDDEETEDDEEDEEDEEGCGLFDAILDILPDGDDD